MFGHVSQSTIGFAAFAMQGKSGGQGLMGHDMVWINVDQSQLTPPGRASRTMFRVRNVYGMLAQSVPRKHAEEQVDHVDQAP